MDCAADCKEFLTLDDLPLYCHTIRYERFFLLSLDLSVNGEKAELSGINSNRLYLRAPQQPSWQIPCEILLTWAEAAGKEYGISRVARLCCGQLPMMEVDFPSKNAIATFLKLLKQCEDNFQMRLKKKMRKWMSDNSSSESISPVNLCVHLYLSSPLREGGASLREVTLANLETCVKMLKAGNELDYRNIMPEDQLLPHRQSV